MSITFWKGFVPILVAGLIHPLLGIIVAIALVVICLVKPEWLGF